MLKLPSLAMLVVPTASPATNQSTNQYVPDAKEDTRLSPEPVSSVALTVYIVRQARALNVTIFTH